MEEQQYTNPFAEVHKKAKAFRDRAREANEKDLEIRKNRLVQEFKGIALDKELE